MSACSWCSYHTGHAETCLARTIASPPHFDGETYEPEKDHRRLAGQLSGVLNLMRDGAWRTLAEIAGRVDGSEAGVSARLRDLRKPRFGGYTVERRRRAEGLHEYRLDVETAKESAA